MIHTPPAPSGAASTTVTPAQHATANAIARALIALSSIVLLHAPALAGVIVVASNGTGQATDLPAAVAAAGTQAAAQRETRKAPTWRTSSSKSTNC